MATYDGESNAATTPGVTGRNTATGGVGVFGESTSGEAVHGISHGQAAGVAGYNVSTQGGPAVWGSSTAGEGVHAETLSASVAAIAGFERNSASTAAAVYGEHDGNGPAVYGLAKGNGGGVFGSSAGGEGVHGETSAPGHAAVAGFNNATTAGFAWGVYGSTQVGEGVHGDTKAPGHAAVAGYNACTATDSTNIGAWGVWGFSQTGEGVHGETASETYAAVAGIATNPAGNAAGVYGQSLGKGPAGFFAGNVTVTGTLTAQGDVVLSGGDCAEEFEVGRSESTEPGTVVVIDEEGILTQSQQAYDKKVAGVIAGAGDCKPAIILDKKASAGRLPVALVGKAFCKAEAEHAPIETGDLLTTSGTPGYAMKADDPVRAFGAVIGKALRPLPAGRGLIPILIALQ